MIRNITVLLNVFGLLLAIIPILITIYFKLKYPEAVSVGIIGGDPNSLFTDFLSYLLGGTNNFLIQSLVAGLISLNLFVIIRNK